MKKLLSPEETACVAKQYDVPIEHVVCGWRWECRYSGRAVRIIDTDNGNSLWWGCGHPTCDQCQYGYASGAQPRKWW